MPHDEAGGDPPTITAAAALRRRKLSCVIGSWRCVMSFHAMGIRVTAQLKAEGTTINHKTVSRIMRDNGLQVRPLRRFVRTTDSDHNGPIFPNLVREFVPTMPNQLWVADFSYIAIAKGFVYLAAVLDAWSRRVVGYALARRLDTRLALAALNVAIETRRPPPGCIHHSGRGTQYASEGYREILAQHGFIGSMSRRGNPYDKMPRPKVL
jgi:putative transposase